MSTTVASTDESLLPSELNVTYPATEGQLDADWARTGKHTLSYAGPWRISKSQLHEDGKERGTVSHGPLRVAHIPGMKGTVQERNYTLVRDEEKSWRYLEIVSENEGIKTILWWERLDV